ncbi:MAG: nucleotide sugar dehydrogenase [Desulfobacteraceae bacterium]|nr:nucleotide sugar dehydrogenase [Desulfobacteraceae bacterium]
MKISVFGLGYVGCVSAALLAQKGHRVIGVDVNPEKADIINKGKCPIIEKDLDRILHEVVRTEQNKDGMLDATTDPVSAVVDTDVSLICVGTPSNINGSLKLDYVAKCASEIGEGLKKKNAYHVVALRSTVLPGSVEEAVIKVIQEKSGKKPGEDFGAVMNPEFLREGTSVHDFNNPPLTVIGELDEKSGDMIQSIYHFLDAPVVRTDLRTAEMIKYANNSFHALKVSFANEIGVICKEMGIDSHKVMEIFCMDQKLNLSPYYLKPGFAFGGSCLPKDLRAVNYKARDTDLDVPVLRSVLESNKAHIERVADKIIRTGKKKIGILGLSFKAGTDDLRESPLVLLTETLIGKGFDIRIYDANVSLAKLFGANKEYIEKEIPHISSLMCEKLGDVLSHAELLIIGNKSEEFADILKTISDDKIIYDLVRITDDVKNVSQGYEGICW